MSDTIITNGTIVTQNPDREIVEDGAIFIVDDTIEAVGTASEITADYGSDRIIDADGGLVIPGLINTHTHVSDMLIRGAFTEDRGLYDWIHNAKVPAVAQMTAEEHAVTASMYCLESIYSGTTTFVENDTSGAWMDNFEAKISAYEESGIRSIYGLGLRDKKPPDHLVTYIEKCQVRNPATKHVDPEGFVMETEEALDSIESHIQEHHGSVEGRQSVWPAPVNVGGVSKEAHQRAYELAEKYDVMTTTHVSEAEIHEAGPGMSSIEYLRNIDYLGERTLLGHCVQLDKKDVRILGKTNTRVAHNYMANMRLATGYAPIVEMLENDVAVGLGIDNVNINDTINPLNDIRAMAAGHKGYHRDAGAMTAQAALDMLTIEGARSIHRDDDLGSIEVGKQADIAIVDTNHPHLTPAPDPVAALIYKVMGSEIETVLCAGDVVMSDRQIKSFDRSSTTIMQEAEEAAADIVERANIS